MASASWTCDMLHAVLLNKNTAQANLSCGFLSKPSSEGSRPGLKWIQLIDAKLNNKLLIVSHSNPSVVFV